MLRLLLPALLAALSACGPRLPDLGHMGAGTGELVDGASTRSFSTGELAGRVWLVDFVYTTCGGPCPMISSRFAALQRELPAAVGLLSITVDPEVDDARHLELYAKHFHAEPGRWLFLRMDPLTLENVVVTDMKLPLAKGTLLSRVTHSTKIVLIDAKWRIRGYYDSEDEASVARLKTDALSLARGRPWG
jgi:protein SCO1/2